MNNQGTMGGTAQENFENPNVEMSGAILKKGEMPTNLGGARAKTVRNQNSQGFSKNARKFGSNYSSKSHRAGPYPGAESPRKRATNAGGEANVLEEEGLRAFSETYSPQDWDKASLSWRIATDFENEPQADSMLGQGQNSRGEEEIDPPPFKLRSSVNIEIPPEGVRWVPVQGAGLDKKTFVIPQVTHGLAGKGISAGQFTTQLSRGVVGLQSGPAVLLINKNAIPFQVRKGQRVGSLVPLRRLPTEDSGGPPGRLQRL